MEVRRADKNDRKRHSKGEVNLGAKVSERPAAGEGIGRGTGDGRRGQMSGRRVLGEEIRQVSGD